MNDEVEPALVVVVQHPAHYAINGGRLSPVCMAKFSLQGLWWRAMRASDWVGNATCQVRCLAPWFSPERADDISLRLHTEKSSERHHPTPPEQARSNYCERVALNPRVYCGACEQGRLRGHPFLWAVVRMVAPPTASRGGGGRGSAFPCRSPHDDLLDESSALLNKHGSLSARSTFCFPKVTGGWHGMCQ